MSLLIPTTISEEIGSIVRRFSEIEQKNILSYLQIINKSVDNLQLKQADINDKSNYLCDNSDITELKAFSELFKNLKKLPAKKRKQLISEFNSEAIYAKYEAFSEDATSVYSEEEAMEIALKEIELFRNDPKEIKEICNRH